MIRRHLIPLLLVQLMLLPLAACAQSATGPVEGHDYVVSPDGQRWSTADDRIEVAEVFAYTCHHCADFEPTLVAWKRKQPADVRVDYVPAAFRPTDNYARAAFAFGQMGVLDKLHGPLFHAIHDAQTVPIRNASAHDLDNLLCGHGNDVDRD